MRNGAHYWRQPGSHLARGCAYWGETVSDRSITSSWEEVDSRTGFDSCSLSAIALF
jgi:hypothetical protein